MMDPKEYDKGGWNITVQETWSPQQQLSLQQMQERQQRQMQLQTMQGPNPYQNQPPSYPLPVPYAYKNLLPAGGTMPGLRKAYPYGIDEEFILIAWARERGEKFYQELCSKSLRGSQLQWSTANSGPVSPLGLGPLKYLKGKK